MTRFQARGWHARLLVWVAVWRRGEGLVQRPTTQAWAREEMQNPWDGSKQCTRGAEGGGAADGTWGRQRERHSDNCGKHGCRNGKRVFGSVARACENTHVVCMSGERTSWLDNKRDGKSRCFTLIRRVLPASKNCLPQWTCYSITLAWSLSAWLAGHIGPRGEMACCFQIFSIIKHYYPILCVCVCVCVCVDSLLFLLSELLYTHLSASWH